MKASTSERCYQAEHDHSLMLTRRWVPDARSEKVAANVEVPATWNVTTRSLHGFKLCSLRARGQPADAGVQKLSCRLLSQIALHLLCQRGVCWHSNHPYTLQYTQVCQSSCSIQAVARCKVQCSRTGGAILPEKADHSSAAHIQ